MTDRYLIPLPDGRWLALGKDELDQGLCAGQEVMPCASDTAPTNVVRPEWLTAEQMAAMSNMDASWFLTAARLNEIPHIRLGKYVRFDPISVRAYLERPDTRISDPKKGRKPMIRNEIPRPASGDVSDSTPVKGARHGR